MIIADVHTSNGVALVFLYYINSFGQLHLIDGQVIDLYDLHMFLLYIAVQCYIAGIELAVM